MTRQPVRLLEGLTGDVQTSVLGVVRGGGGLQHLCGAGWQLNDIKEI